MKSLVYAIFLVLSSGALCWKFTTNITAIHEITGEYCCLIKNHYPVKSLELILFFSGINRDFMLSKKINLKDLYEKLWNSFNLEINKSRTGTGANLNHFIFGHYFQSKNLPGFKVVLRI